MHSFGGGARNASRASAPTFHAVRRVHFASAFTRGMCHSHSGKQHADMPNQSNTHTHTRTQFRRVFNAALGAGVCVIDSRGRHNNTQTCPGPGTCALSANHIPCNNAPARCGLVVAVQLVGGSSHGQTAAAAARRAPVSSFIARRDLSGRPTTASNVPGQSEVYEPKLASLLAGPSGRHSVSQPVKSSQVKSSRVESS